MWSVDKPDYDAKDTYELCISRVRDKELRRRLIAAADSIEDAANEYNLNAINQSLHLFPKKNIVNGDVTRDEMINNYYKRFSAKNAPARAIYDAIKLLPKHDTCPYCNYGVISTLDHVLPKTTYPILAVTPDNLVGCCNDCNKSKSDNAPVLASEAPLHPYFDNIEDREWLAAHVVEGPVPAVLFHITYQNDWTKDKNKRLDNQFNILGLGALYSKLAAREISGIKQILMRFFHDGGEEAVKAEVLRQYSSWKDCRQNSWQSVTFLALSKSTWFCRTGHGL